MQNHKNLLFTGAVIFVLTFLIFGIDSCKKKDDNSLVHVEILSPKVNSYYVLPDTIHVEIEISSDKQPEYVKVSVVNAKQIPVFDPYYFYLESNETDLKFAYALENKDISNEGQLFLQVTVAASDLLNTFTKIQIESRPPQFKGYYLFTRPGVNETKLVFVGLEKEIESIAKFSGDYTGSDFSAAHDMLYLRTNSADRLHAYQKSSDSFLWEVEPPADYPEISSLYASSTKVYSGFGNGMIAGFADVSGQQLMSTPVMLDSVSKKLFTTSNYIIADFKVKNKNSRGLHIYFKSTGAFFQRTEHNIEIAEFFIKQDENQLIVFGNENGHGIVSHYFFEGNNFSKPLQITENQIGSVSRVGETIFLYSHDNKLFTIDLETQLQKTLVILNENIVSIKYNDVHQTVYIVTENSVLLYGYPSMILSDSLTSAEQIMGIELRYAY